MAALSPKAAGVQVVEATADAAPHQKRSFAVVIEREKADEAIRSHLGPGWSVELTSRRLSPEEAGKLNFWQGEWGAIRQMPESAGSAEWHKGDPPTERSTVF